MIRYIKKQYSFLVRNKDFLYFTSNVPYKLSLSLMVIGTQFVLAWYLANYLTKETYGQFQLILAIIGTMSIFSLTGMKDSIVRYVSQRQDFSLIYTTSYMAKFSIIGSLILSFVASYMMVLPNQASVGYALAIGSVVFPFYYTLDNYISYLNAKKNFKAELISYSSVKIIQVAVVILALQIYNNNLLIVCVSYFFSEVAINTIFYFYFSKNIKKTSIKKEVLDYGWFVSKIKTIVNLASQIDRFLIGMMISPSLLAVYSIAIMFPNKIKGIINPVLFVLFPAFSANEMKLKTRKIKYVFLFSLLIFLSAIVALPFLIKLLFPLYTESIKYALLYSVIILFLPLNVLFDYYFKAVKNELGYKNSYLFSRIVKIVIIAPMIYFLGLLGAVLTGIIEQILNFVISAYYFRKTYEKNS